MGNRAKGKPREPVYDRTLLYGMPAIARYLEVSVGTVHRWKRTQGFPMGKLPGGVWCTSTELIDRWILARDPMTIVDTEV